MIIDTANKKTGIIFLVYGLFGFAVAITNMFLWRFYWEFGGNPISGLNYLSYFTYWGNLITFAWLVLTGFAILLKKEKLRRFLTSPAVFCGVVLYIVIVGLIFYGIIRWTITHIPWIFWYARLVDFFFHAITPLMMILLFVFVKKVPSAPSADAFFSATTVIDNDSKSLGAKNDEKKLKQKHLLLYLILPMVYFIFSFIRGQIINWYPYPFIDPNWDVIANLGISPWLYIPFMVVVFGGVFYLMGFVIMKIWNRLSKYENQHNK